MVALAFSQREYNEIKRHVEKDHPAIACGFLIGTKNKVSAIIPAANRATNTRFEYLVDPMDQLRADSTARKTGKEIIGFYSSRGAAARPGERDRESAWPEYFYVYVGLRDGLVSAVRAFVLRSDRGGFDETTLVVDGKPQVSHPEPEPEPEPDHLVAAYIITQDMVTKEWFPLFGPFPSFQHGWVTLNFTIATKDKEFEITTRKAWDIVRLIDIFTEIDLANGKPCRYDVARTKRNLHRLLDKPDLAENYPQVSELLIEVGAEYYVLSVNGHYEWFPQYGPFAERWQADQLMRALFDHARRERANYKRFTGREQEYTPYGVASLREIRMGKGILEGHYDYEMTRRSLARLAQTPDRGERYLKKP